MRLTLMFLAVAWITSSPVWATRVEYDKSVLTVSKSTPSVVTSATAAPSFVAVSNVDDSYSLREGAVTAIAISRNQIEINGSWLTIDSTKTRLFRRGFAVTSDLLCVGQVLNFTLLSRGADRYTFNVIYIP